MAKKIKQTPIVISSPPHGNAKKPDARVVNRNVTLSPEDRAIIAEIGKMMGSDKLMPILRHSLRVAAQQLGIKVE